MNKIKKNLLLYIACGFAIAAIFMMFAPASHFFPPYFSQSFLQSFTGVQMTFGYAEEISTGSGTVLEVYFKFSANILTYLFLISGIVFAILAALGKFDKISKVVSAVSFILAGVLYFFMIQLSSFGEGLIKVGYSAILIELVLDIGPILGGIFSLIAALLVILDLFKDKILKKD